MSIRFATFFVMVFCHFSLFGGHIEGPAITRERVQQFLQENETNWLKRMPEQGTRLFYTENDWPEVLARLQSEKGRYPEFRQTVLDLADSIAARPTPVYAELEDGSVSELWQRRVGDDIFLLCLAVKLDESPLYRRRLRETVIAGCEYPQWGKSPVKNKDLAAGHMSRAVALAWDWHRDLFSSDEQELILGIMRDRVGDLMQGLYGEMSWDRSYTVNHNHVCVSAIGLAGLAFYGDLPEAREWLAAACLNFDYVFDFSSEDGSTDEGVSYWSYSMVSILQFIEGTRTVTDSASGYESPFLQNAARFRVACATPGFQGSVPWADSKLIDFYGPHHILARLASEYDDHQAQYLMDHLPFRIQGGSDSEALLLMWYDAEVEAKRPTQVDFHVETWDVMTTRSGWEENDYLLSLKSGYTNRNHSHLDAGSLTFVFGDEWLILTPGYGTGKNQSGFWNWNGSRWSFFSNSTEAHSTLLINNKNQRFGLKDRSTIDEFSSTNNFLWTQVDLTGVYEEANLVQRGVLHVRGDYFLVFDRVESDDSVEVAWLAQVENTAKIEKETIQIEAKAGNLKIELLSPHGSGFVEHKPYSEHVDKRNESQRSYKIVQSGTGLGYTLLLQPQFKGEEPVKLHSTVNSQEKGKTVVVLQSAGWTDYVWVNEDVRPMDMDRWDIFEDISVEAETMVVRISENSLTRLFVQQLKYLDSDILEIAANKLVSLELASEDGVIWTLDLASEFQGRIGLNRRFSLYDESGNQISTSNDLTLREGTYFIESEAATVPQFETGTSRQNLNEDRKAPFPLGDS